VSLLRLPEPARVGDSFAESCSPPCSGVVLPERKQVPPIGSVTVGFGVQVFPRAGRSFTAGWKYRHLSNNYQAHLHRGIDSGVFYEGFSVFRAKQK
jgi:hypothetical protein